MDSHFEHGGLYLDRSPAEIKELVSRLNRLEGQIRGIRAMIEDGRHCRDELQQINAASAALRKVAAILASARCIGCATRSSMAGRSHS